MKLRDRFKKLRLSNQTNVIFGAVVTVATVANVVAVLFQYNAAKENARSSSAQMDQLISVAKISAYAADHNVQAARNFAFSSEGIDTGIANAVNRLQLQANAIEEARLSAENESARSLNVAIDNARSDQRAYIVASLHLGSVQPCDREGRFCAEYQYLNVGRTPAVDVKTFATLKRDGLVEQGVSVDDIRKLPVSLNTKDEAGPLVNSEPAKGQAKELRSPGLPPCHPNGHGSDCRIYVFGLIQYKDIFGAGHETGFCVSIPVGAPTSPPPAFCSIGNWFDERPSRYKN